MHLRESDPFVVVIGSFFVTFISIVIGAGLLVAHFCK